MSFQNLMGQSLMGQSLTGETRWPIAGASGPQTESGAQGDTGSTRKRTKEDMTLSCSDAITLRV